jgi:hypothetical protein
MNQSKFLARLLLPLLAYPPGLVAQVRHFAWHESDTFVQCARQLFAKDVFISVSAAELINQSEAFSCPQDKEALSQQGLALVKYEKPAFVYFASWSEVSHYMKSELRELGADQPDWELDASVKLWTGPTPSEQLDESAIQAIANAIRTEGRPVPVPWQRRKDKKVFFVDERLLINSRELRPNVRSIIGLMPSGGRIFYGELHGRQFELAWDSPLFDSDSGLTYKDLNGDGISEILLSCAIPPYYHGLTIFDISGNLLTKQTDGCDHLSVLADSCAIVGYDFQFVPGVGKSLDILTSGDPHHEAKAQRYRLVAGAYQLVKEKRASVSKSE